MLIAISVHTSEVSSEVWSVLSIYQQVVSIQIPQFLHYFQKFDLFLLQHRTNILDLHLQVEPEEITDIMNDFNKPGSLAPTGLYLGG